MTDSERDEIISYATATLIKIEKDIKSIKVAVICELIAITAIAILVIPPL